MRRPELVALGQPTVAMIEKHVMAFDDKLSMYLDMTQSQLAHLRAKSNQMECLEVARTLCAMADTLRQLAEDLSSKDDSHVRTPD